MPSFLEDFERYSQAGDLDVFSFSGRITFASAREFIDAVLSRDKHAKNVSLFICTFGGDPHSAFRMVRCLKKHYSKGKIRLLVDGPCKSAGTLVALGVDEIAMGPRGELGPLDTQLTKQDELLFMNSGLDILQALSVVTTNAFDSCFANMIEVVKRSGGSISTKTAAEFASNLTAGVFQPIMAQIDPLRMGEANRSMRIAREYGERLKSKLLKPGALDKLVQDFPSHGFVIDKDEAGQYFTNIDDLTPDEVNLAEFMADAVRWPKEEPEVFDISSFAEHLRARQAAPSQQQTNEDAVESADGKSTTASEGKVDEPSAGNNGRGHGTATPESTGQNADLTLATDNGIE